AAIKCAIAVENARSKAAEDCRQARSAGRDDIARDDIRVDGWHTESFEFPPDDTLSGGNAAGEPPTLHCRSRCKFKVLSSKLGSKSKVQPSIEPSGTLRNLLADFNLLNFELMLATPPRARRVFGRRHPFLDERIPLVALRTLPEQLRAPGAAMHADVRIEVEDGAARQLYVLLNQCRVQLKSPECLPHLVMDGQTVRVVRQRIEEQLQRFAMPAIGGQVSRQQNPVPPAPGI